MFVGAIDLVHNVFLTFFLYLCQSSMAMSYECFTAAAKSIYHSVPSLEALVSHLSSWSAQDMRMFIDVD